MESIAVIILNYNTWRETIQEIDIVHSTCGIDYSNIIVVDNASINDSLIKLKEAQNKYQFILINSLENKGYAAGNNIGLRYAYGKYKHALILNNDIIIEDKKMIENLLDIFYEDNSVAIANPDIISPEGYLFNRDSKRPNFYDLTIGMYSYKKKGRMLVDLGGYGYVYRPQGCCMLVDLEKLKDVDFLDEHTFLYNEEPILAERLLSKNYKCACVFTTTVIHNHSNTIKREIDRHKVRQIKNDSFKYYLKEYRKFNIIQIKICIIFNYLKLLVIN